MFCLTFGWNGARISEVLALTPASIDFDGGCEHPDCRDSELANQRIWTWSRTTAWRRVKEIMAVAGISGTPAMTKGLRHGFGVNAFQASMPPHLVQRWLGCDSLRTTSIYGDVIGPDERAFAMRTWQSDRTAPVIEGAITS